MPSSEQTNIRIFVDSTKLQSICQTEMEVVRPNHINGYAILDGNS
jgi:hypothetical protein